MALQRTSTGPVGAGKRDKFVYLVPVVFSRGTTGFPVETDGTRVGVWAYKQERTAQDMAFGKERFAAGQLSSPYTTTWEMDYRPEIDPDLVSVPKAFVLTYEGRRFDILTADVVGRKAGIQLLTLARMG